MSENIHSWIGVDFDGTLAFYDRWRGEDHLGKPVPLMVKRVQHMLAKGIRVKIFTARVTDDGSKNVENIRTLIEDWTERHIGTRLEVTNIKDYGMTELYDDRAYQVILNTGKIVIRKKESK